MKKASRYIVAGAAVALLPLAAFAQSPTPEPQSEPQASPPTESQQPSQGGGATFESLDTNSDGKISKTEAQANSTVTEQFSRYDVNGDGFIERAEVSQANSAPSETPKQ
jgi:hypothetical protein